MFFERRLGGEQHWTHVAADGVGRVGVVQPDVVLKARDVLEVDGAVRTLALPGAGSREGHGAAAVAVGGRARGGPHRGAVRGNWRRGNEKGKKNETMTNKRTKRNRNFCLERKKIYIYLD